MIRLIFTVFVLALLPAPAAPGQALGLDVSRLADGRARRATSANPDWRRGQDDWTSVQPGQTLVMAELDGPGVITHVWNTINSQEAGHPRLLRLRIYWDGESEPSVDCPLGDFFAGGHGLDVPLDSLPVRVTANGRARNCYWPMPFAKSARVTLTNEGRRGAAVYYQIDWRKLDALPADAAYFHAAYRQAFPAPAGENYRVADIAGRGHYVGTVLGVYSLAPGWWGEGDDFFFVDGESDPSLAGTGTEDYFGDAWGFVQQSGPYYGTPLVEDIKQPVSRQAAYRWHLPDPIPFDESLRVELEHRGVVRNAEGKIVSHTGDRPDDYSSVAFWYQVEPHKPFGELPPGYARLGFDETLTLEGAALVEASAATAGEITVEPHTHNAGRGVEDVVVDTLRWTPGDDGVGATLTVALPPAEVPITGLLLSVRHMAGGGMFDVLIDGEPVGERIDLRSRSSVVTTMPLVLPAPLPPGEHVLEFRVVFREIGAAADVPIGALGLDAVLVRVRPRL